MYTYTYSAEPVKQLVTRLTVCNCIEELDSWIASCKLKVPSLNSEILDLSNWKRYKKIIRRIAKTFDTAKSDCKKALDMVKGIEQICKADVTYDLSHNKAVIICIIEALATLRACLKNFYLLLSKQKANKEQPM